MFRRALQAVRQQRFAAGASGFALGSIALSGIAYAQTPNRIEAKDINVEVKPLSEGDLSSSKPQSERRAYDPETGEIDWDCPCLGGMAHGPCGEEFKEAFSCFVYSKSEIKGSECIPKFELMRNCFKKYPEVYADFQDDPADDDASSSEPNAPNAPAEIEVDVVEAVPVDIEVETVSK